ncbi:M67 family metallopeptidase [Candidatus Bathyarchaeota archaeon]|nr:M67 family metallopeptidase [Candidatus Bathyarchaeota archaeon]
MMVKLKGRLFRLLLEEVRRRYPIEACGILFGYVNSDEVRIEVAVFLRNMLESEFMFQIDPEELLKVLIEYEGRGLSHIGFFHSHPRCSKPSTMDLRYMKLWPGSIWVIVSCRESRMEAYRVIDGCLEKATIVIEDDNIV